MGHQRFQKKFSKRLIKKLNERAVSEQDTAVFDIEVGDMCDISQVVRLHKKSYEDGLFVDKPPSPQALRWLDEWNPDGLGIYLGEMRCPFFNGYVTTPRYPFFNGYVTTPHQLMYYQRFLFEGRFVYMKLRVMKEIVSVIRW